MAAEFYEASESLEALARELIQKHHGHLIEANIKYLFRTGNWEAKKRETWGQAKKVGKEVKYLTDYDFIITIHRDVWEQINDDERRALLDHELQHCCAGTDDAGNKVWYIQGHDVEDFYAIIRRHGLWSKALRKMESLLNQTELDLEPAAAQEDGLAELPGGPELAELPGRPTLQIVGSKTQALPEGTVVGVDYEEDKDGDQEPIDAEYIDVDVLDREDIKDTGTDG